MATARCHSFPRPLTHRLACTAALACLTVPVSHATARALALCSHYSACPTVCVCACVQVSFDEFLRYYLLLMALRTPWSEAAELFRYFDADGSGAASSGTPKTPAAVSKKPAKKAAASADEA